MYSSAEKNRPLYSDGLRVDTGGGDVVLSADMWCFNKRPQLGGDPRDAGTDELLRLSINDT